MLIATEGALWGSIKAHDFLPNTVIVSDDAGQFNVGQHGLCWVHAERLGPTRATFTDAPRAAQRRFRALIWRVYRDLKAYRQHPVSQRKAALRARFDRIFTRKTGFVTLDRLLARLLANKGELLMVLDRPEIPLHTNGSENDIRCQVTKRKVMQAQEATPVATAAMPSSASPRPAQSSESYSGTISARVSLCQTNPMSQPCRNSSSSAAPPHECQLLPLLHLL